MNQNLDTLKNEIPEYLREQGFVVFYGYPREWDTSGEVAWDSKRYPDYKAFAETAKALGVKVVLFHHYEFSTDLVDEALDDLSAIGYEYEDQRAMERRLRELSVYEVFTAQIELSYSFGGSLYRFELETEWYKELNEILEELDLRTEPGEDDETLGGYYSKN